MDVHDVLDALPLGIFQYRLLAICGLAFMADALEVNLLGFVSVCAGSEWHLTNQQTASIAGIVFLGIIVGSMVWGYIADTYGRKITFFLVSLTISIAGFCTGFASSYSVLLLLRAVVGFGIGGANIPFDILAEFMSTKHRGPFLVFIEYFWTVGGMLVCGLAWAVLHQYGWKFLSTLAAVPVAISSILSIMYLPESPRWLILVGRTDDAATVLRHAANVNDHALLDLSLNSNEVGPNSTSEMKLLCSGHFFRRSFFPLCLIWASFGFTYYGLILFIGRLFSNGDSDSCNFDYLSIFLNSVAEIIGVSASAVVVNKGRKKFQCVFYCLAAVSVCLLAVVPPTAVFLVISMVSRATIMAASNITWVMTPELLPTHSRSLGHAVCVACSKLGAFVSPYIIISNLSLTSVAIILASVNLFAAATSQLLRETAGGDLDQKIYAPEDDNSEEKFTLINNQS